jgi:hypothetical protein
VTEEEIARFGRAAVKIREDLAAAQKLHAQTGQRLNDKWGVLANSLDTACRNDPKVKAVYEAFRKADAAAARALTHTTGALTALEATVKATGNASP